jgi:hypothetical protein
VSSSRNSPARKSMSRTRRLRSSALRLLNCPAVVRRQPQGERRSFLDPHRWFEFPWNAS